MKLKLSKFFLLLSLLFFISSCAFLLKPTENDKEKLLTAHLNYWENIRIDGIIEVNYKNFIFRKNITIKKNKKAFRIDIYDSGIFGMKPTPFFSVYYDSILTIRTPDQKIEQFDLQDNQKQYLSILFNLSDFLAIKDEIIKHKKLDYKDTIILFSDDMKLSKISSSNDSTMVMFDYLNDLDSIIFQKEKEEIINIQIDKITHPDEEINSLK